MSSGISSCVDRFECGWIIQIQPQFVINTDLSIVGCVPCHHNRAAGTIRHTEKADMAVLGVNRLGLGALGDSLKDTRWARIQTSATINTRRGIKSHRKQGCYFIHGLWNHRCRRRWRQWDSRLCVFEHV